MADPQNTTPEITLSERELTKTPFELFARWFQHAANYSGFADPNAMCLSTVQEDLTPDSRMVLLKHFDQRGFVFFTNSLSRKGRALAVHPRVALNFYWDPLHIQIRIQGVVEIVSDEESDTYFKTRSRRSQLGAVVSRQSEPLEKRESLEAAVREKDQEYAGREIPRPTHWHGYRVVPFRIEFWKDRENRLHDRFAYTKTDTGWEVQRLSP